MNLLRALGGLLSKDGTDYSAAIKAAGEVLNSRIGLAAMVMGGFIWAILSILPVLEQIKSNTDSIGPTREMLIELKAECNVSRKCKDCDNTARAAVVPRKQPWTR